MITYNFIKYLILYIKYKRILDKTYKDEDIIQGLSKMFQSEFKQDWVGRLYCVINPYIRDGKYEPNTRIFNYTETEANTDVFVEQYIMNTLNAANLFIKANNLFDLLTYEIRKIDDYGNYLFIIKPIPYNDFIKYTKLFTIPLIILIVVIILLITLL